MKVVLYTIHCPACKVLQTKLDRAGINYDLVDDVDKMNELKIKSAPMLSVDGKLMKISEANQWIKDQQRE